MEQYPQNSDANDFHSRILYSGINYMWSLKSTIFKHKKLKILLWILLQEATRSHISLKGHVNSSRKLCKWEVEGMLKDNDEVKLWDGKRTRKYISNLKTKNLELMETERRKGSWVESLVFGEKLGKVI